MPTISRSDAPGADAGVDTPRPASGAAPPAQWARVLRRARAALRRWRRDAKALMPYVRRREFAKLERKYAALTDAIGRPPRAASDAWLVARKPVTGPLHGEVGLFLTHHRTPGLQPHVARHIEQLLANGIQVVLILNADDANAVVRLPACLAEQLEGVYVRENVGFDFAGWAHLHAHLRPQLQPSRLYLVNDSIVGPIDAAGFQALIARVRASSADLVGLTEACAPLPHLQSYFLALQQRLARSPSLALFFDGVLCFADKATVIDVYELHFTRYLQDHGFRSEALFPALGEDRHSANDTFFRWDELLELGFPFVKASVMREFERHPRMLQVAQALRRRP